MPLRRAGTAQSTGVRYGPGSAAHRHSASKTRVNALMAKSYALRCVRGTKKCTGASPRRKDHHHLAALEAGVLLDLGVVGDVGLDLVQ
jgi:hypothetical protein